MPRDIDLNPKHYASPETQADLLRDAFASGDQAFVSAALTTIAAARGVSLLLNDNPKLDAVFSALDWLGFDLMTVVRKPSPPWGT